MQENGNVYSLKSNIKLWFKNNNSYFEKSSSSDWCLKENCLLIMFLCRQLAKNHRKITKRTINNLLTDDNFINENLTSISLVDTDKELIYVNSTYGWESGRTLYASLVNLSEAVASEEDISPLFHKFLPMTFTPSIEQDVMYIENKVVCYCKKDVNKIKLVYKKISTEIQSTEFENILLIFLSFNNNGGVEYQV